MEAVLREERRRQKGNLKEYCKVNRYMWGMAKNLWSECLRLIRCLADRGHIGKTELFNSRLPVW